MRLKLLLFCLLLSFLPPYMSQEMPIFTEKPIKGVYRNAQEFLWNSPSIRDSLLLKENPRTTDLWHDTKSVMVYNFTENKKVKDAWGFSDGDNVYIFHQIEYFKINIEQEKINFFAYPVINNESLSIFAIIGGVIGNYFGMLVARNRSQATTYRDFQQHKKVGGIIGGGVFGGIFGGIGNAAILAATKKRKWLYHIDPVIGDIHLLPIDNATSTLPKVNVIFFRQDLKKSKDILEVIIDDDVLIEHAPESSHKLSVSMSKMPLKICINGYDNSCIYLDVRKSKDYYIQVKSRVNKIPMLEYVLDEYGTSKTKKILKKLSKNQK